jgi:hypothetical protein
VKTDPFATVVLELLRKAPENLLLIGGYAFDAAPIGVRTTAIPDLAAMSDLEGLPEAAAGGPFDAIVWRAQGDLAAAAVVLHRHLMERGRLLLAVIGPEQRRAALLASFAAGFVLIDERVVGDAEGPVVLALRRDEYHVAGFADGAEREILRLFAPSFHAERSAAHWTWKYRENPWGNQMITVATDPQGELVAHYAGYPVPWALAHGGERRDLLCLQIGDTMTHERHRGVGRGPTSLLGRCVRHFYTAFCEGRVAFNYGFNTGNIQKFSILFVRAQRIEPVGYWVRSADPPAAAGYRVAPARADDSFTRFFERAAPAYGFLVRRTAEYLRWRYEACPDDPPFVLLAARRLWRIVGWSVFRRKGDVLLWCDALFLPEHAAAADDLLRAALGHPAFQGVRTIEAWFPPRPQWWRQKLGNLGFSARPEPHDLAVMLVPHLEQDADRLLRDVAYYTLGDGDLA